MFVLFWLLACIFFFSILFSVVSTLFSVVFWLLYCKGFGVPVFLFCVCTVCSHFMSRLAQPHC